MEIATSDVVAPRRGPRWAGAILGLVAALGGLAVAEIVAASRRSLQSPVLDVGDRVVDGVPTRVKSLAIEWFGTNDKLALLVGIALLLTVYALSIGIVAVGRRWRLAVAGTALFGLVGAYASQSTRRDAPWYAVAPSIVGALVAAALVVWLRRRLIGPTTASTPTEQHEPTDASDGDRLADAPARAVDETGRRRFLVAAGATSVTAAAIGATGRIWSERRGVAGQRRSIELPSAASPLPAAPPDIAVPVDGVSPFFTPTAEFYRIDTALTVPQVSVDGWRLDISGMVDRPRSLTYADLLDRELVEVDITLTCVSNEIGGSLLGTARWLGVRLDDLLADAGVDPDADQVVGRSVDGYTCGFPVAALDGRAALVAIGMNGEPLPLEHGYPARLVVPGLFGYVSATKWLSEIELTRFDRFDQYWVERGWVDDAPIELQSRIDTPRGLARLSAGPVAIAGVAWAQTRGIDRVEVSIDDGAWITADLAAELNDVTWRQWSVAWDATPGRHTITVRATDRTGAIQTADRSEPFPSGATGHHQIVVLVD
jgi:DMSO/TMAO reductase YedYZ molybdopterin-dependent catalytic subunit